MSEGSDHDLAALKAAEDEDGVDQRLTLATAAMTPDSAASRKGAFAVGPKPLGAPARRRVPSPTALDPARRA